MSREEDYLNHLRYAFEAGYEYGCGKDKDSADAGFVAWVCKSLSSLRERERASHS